MSWNPIIDERPPNWTKKKYRLELTEKEIERVWKLIHLPIVEICEEIKVRDLPLSRLMPMVRREKAKWRKGLDSED